MEIDIIPLLSQLFLFMTDDVVKRQSLKIIMLEHERVSEEQKSSAGFGWCRINILHSSWCGLCFGFVMKRVLIMQRYF